MEIERKFLLKDAMIFHKLTNNQIELSKSFIEQFYLHINENTEIRYRKQNDKYYYTIKNGKGIAREELEHLVSKSEYIKAKKKRISQIILKERHDFIVDENRFSLDIYLGNLSGLITLEVEFGSLEKAENFKLDSVFDDLNLEEVTEDIKFKNKYLSLWGNPNVDFNFDKSLLAIKNNPNLELNFPSYLDACDGFKLALNRVIFTIVDLKENYINNTNSRDLKYLAKLFKESINLLKISKELFEPNIYDEIFKSIENIFSKIEERSNLEDFIKYFQKSNSAEKIISSLKFIKENQKLDTFLASDETVNFLTDYNMFLTINSDFYQNKEIALKKFVSYCIDKKTSIIKNKLENINEESKKECFYECKKELEEFECLLDNFHSMFDLELFSKTLKKTKKLNKTLKKLELREKLIKTIDMFNKVDNNIDLETYRKNISIDIFKFREKFLDERKKFIKRLDRVKKLIKIYC